MNKVYVNVKYLKAIYNKETQERDFLVYDVKSVKSRINYNVVNVRTQKIDPLFYAKQIKNTLNTEYNRKKIPLRDFENKCRSGIFVFIEDEPCETCEDVEKLIHEVHREEWR